MIFIFEEKNWAPGKMCEFFFKTLIPKFHTLMLLSTWRRIRKFIQYCYGTGALLKNGQTYKKKTFQACAKGGMSLLGPLGFVKAKNEDKLKKS